jgi:predicted ATPase/DNA-binding CsgD family transcriptional regulator
MGPTNLPEQFTSFVGRSREREQVRGALASTRLLVLTGAGGAGKTRLALQTAVDASEQFSEGVWWLELAPLAGGALVAPAMADVLGVRPLPGQTPVQAIVHRLADDRALVVLDNCEHVAEAAAELGEALLRGCPRVVVLATSREPLRLPGESDWRVPPLSVPAAGDVDMPAAVGASDAGRLFLERAAKVAPDFILTGDNAQVIARICRELDGLPLAIELAAARVRMLSAEQIADGLSDQLWLLTGGPRGALRRQQTLRASVEWSFGLLSTDELALASRLAVFVGGWVLEAAEQVCAGDGVEPNAILDLLTSLVDKSLVVVEQYDRAARYRLLETVRQYTFELLARGGELAALRERHLDYFLTLAERAAVRLDLPRDLGWLSVLQPESANFDAAIGHALQADPERALRIGVALTAWWELGGRFAAGQNALTQALEASDPSSPLRARALWCCGHLARFGGDAESTARCVPQALDIAEKLGDDVTVARALVTLGHLRLTVDPQGCRAGLLRAIELARKTGDDWALVMGLSALGRSFLISDDASAGEDVFAEAEATVERTGLDGITWAVSGLAWFAMVRAEHERVASLCDRSLSAARELGDPVTEAFANDVLALNETMRGRPDAARERTLASEARAIATGAGFTFPLTRTELGRAHAARGDLDSARRVLAGVVASGGDSGWLLCRAILVLADVLRAQGDTGGALTRIGEALDISERIGARSLTATGREILARLAIDRHDWAEAETLAHGALAQRVEIDARAWLPQSLDTLAAVAAGVNSNVEAARLLGAAQRARADLGLVRWTADAPAFDALERNLEQQMGADSYGEAHGDGAAMPLDEAIAWARRGRGARRRPSDGWESLTPTEQQVVKLVVQGLTNLQIADRMFISRSTVKVHLAHIFKKLGVVSRAQLAGQAVSQTS